jgi:hypothetical protein
MKLNIKNIFLFDGAGAFFSFLGTGLVFPLFSQELGVPAETFYLLATFPLVYCLYSFVCHFLVSQKKLWMLALIMIANLFYCLFSFAILLTHNEVTPIGQALIAGEILIILGVVFVEYKIYKSLMLRLD